TSTGVLQMDLVSKQDIEDRPGKAVVMKRRLGGVEFDYPLGVAIFEDYSQLSHRWCLKSLTEMLGTRHGISTSFGAYGRGAETKSALVSLRAGCEGAPPIRRTNPVRGPVEITNMGSSMGKFSSKLSAAMAT